MKTYKVNLSVISEKNLKAARTKSQITFIEPTILARNTGN